MISTQWEEFYDASMPAHDGLRCVNYRDGRLEASDYYCFFVKDEDDLKRRFSMFKPAHIGYYAGKFRSDEGNGHHFTFVGVKE